GECLAALQRGEVPKSARHTGSMRTTTFDPEPRRKRWLIPTAVSSVAVILVAAGVSALLLGNRSGAEPTVSFAPDVTVMSQNFTEELGIEMKIGPWVFDRDRLIVSFAATATCASDDQGGLTWYSDAG